MVPLESGFDTLRQIEDRADVPAVVGERDTLMLNHLCSGHPDPGTLPWGRVARAAWSG